MAAEPGTARTPGRIVRTILSVLFGVIGVVGVLASVVAVWSHRTVFDSETVAASVDRALLNPEVNEALATYFTDQVMDSVPLDDLVTERVPEELEPFVPVLVGGVRNVVHEGFTRVLEDGRAREALVAVVERAHGAVMRVLEGDGLADGFTVDDNEVSVNLLPLISRGLERLQERGILEGVELPELTPDGDPEQQIADLEEAIGRSLPDDFGQLVVYRSENVANSQAAVARAQDAMAVFQRSVVGVIALTVVALGASVALAVRRRRAALALLLNVIAALVIGRVVVRTFVEEVPSLVTKPGARAALEEMVTSLTEGLLRLVSVGLLVSAALALIAFVLGNERIMARARGAAGAGPGVRTALDENRDAIVLIAAALALLVLTLAGFSWLSLLVVLALVALAAWAAWAPRPSVAALPEPADDASG